MPTFNTGRPISYYDFITSPDLVQRQGLNRVWGRVKNHSRTIATLSMLNTRAASMAAVEGKQPQWAIGDFLGETETLKSAFAYNGTQITLTNKYHKPQDIFRLFDTAFTPDKYAIVRLESYVSGSSSAGYTWNCTVLSTDATTSSFATATTAVHKLSSAVTYDDSARDYTTAKGDIAKNVVQSSRDSYGAGLFSRSESFYTDQSLEHLSMLGYEHEARKLNQLIHMSAVAYGGADVSSSGDDFGVTGGFPYFFNPHNASFSDTGGVRTLAANGYTGTNHVQTGTAITVNTPTQGLNYWASKICEFGSRDKIVFCSGQMWLYMQAMMATMTNVRINMNDLNTVVPTFADVWNLPVAYLGFCRLWFVVDYGLTNVKQYVYDSSTTNVADPLKWMVAIDPEYTAWVPMKTVDGTVHNLRTTKIDKINNDRIDKVEVEWAGMLYVNDPRTGGYFGITGS